MKFNLVNCFKLKVPFFKFINEQGQVVRLYFQARYCSRLVLSSKVLTRFMKSSLMAHRVKKFLTGCAKAVLVGK